MIYLLSNVALQLRTKLHPVINPHKCAEEQHQVLVTVYELKKINTNKKPKTKKPYQHLTLQTSATINCFNFSNK